VSEDRRQQIASTSVVVWGSGRTQTYLARILAMTTTSLADAKDRLSEIIKSAQETHERFVITKNGKPAVVLISVDDLEALEETLEILSDAKLVAAIRKGRSEAAAGRFASEAEVRGDLARRQARH
jgi:antitoxin YefM